MPTAQSTPNIALIKYWGNRNDELRLPAADSVSMTLNTPQVKISVEHAKIFTEQSFEANGKQKILKEKDIARFGKHLELTKTYLQALKLEKALPDSLAIEVRSEIPPAIGIASSAAVGSCLAEAMAGLIKTTKELSRREIGIIARLFSGSASRGVFGGFSAMIAGTGDDIDAAYGQQIADENHWSLHDIIIVSSQEEKKVGSTEGHTAAHASPLFKDRIAAIPYRQKECIDAIRSRDFQKLQHVAEEDAVDMHQVMRTSVPALNYLSDETHRIIKEIAALRKTKNLPVLFTMDAGPTVHLMCTEEAVSAIREYAHAQKDSTIFEAKVGRGSALL